MITEADSQKLIEKAAEKMQGMDSFKAPEWALFVKTGPDKERVPSQKNWWQLRAASLLRKLYLNQQGIGVSRLRSPYGSRKNMGHKPDRKIKASGSVIRKILQQLESAGFVKTEKGKGRIITAEGHRFLNGIAKELKKG